MKHVWIVEMWIDTPGNERWDPTVGCALNRDDGRHELEIWREHNPDDKFRLVKYVRAL